MTSLEEKIKVLLYAKLSEQPKKRIQTWFNQALQHALSNEDYKLAARLRNANARYQRQIKRTK